MYKMECLFKASESPGLRRDYRILITDIIIYDLPEGPKTGITLLSG